MGKMFQKYFQVVQFIKTFTSTGQSVCLKSGGINYLPRRWAGHSKWQNIKSTKEHHDMRKAQTFSRISRLMIQAVRRGGENVAQNAELKVLMEEAQRNNMPKSTIEKAIASAKKQASERPYWTVFLGPKGLVVAFEVEFANSKPPYLMSKMNQVKKLGLKMETHYQNICTEKGIIVTDFLEGAGQSYEKAVEDGIEIGVNEVYEDDKSLIFECLPERLDSLCQQLSKKGYTIQSATSELDFCNTIKLSEDEITEIENLISKLQSQNEEILRACYNVEQVNSN